MKDERKPIYTETGNGNAIKAENLREELLSNQAQTHPEHAGLVQGGLPSRERVQDSLGITRSLTDRQDGLPRRRMIGGGSKLGVDVSKLAEMGYTCYWRNNVDGRVEEALENGYEFVRPDEITETSLRITASDMGDKVSRTVGYSDKGDPIVAYLMKIRSDWKKENDAFYQQRCDKIDAAIRKGTLTPVEEGYLPRDGIHYNPRSR